MNKKSGTLIGWQGRYEWKIVLLIPCFMILAFACVMKDDGDNGTTQSAYGWSWESGSDSVGQEGFYGTRGTPSSSNMPGARGYQLIWQEASGKLWLFGGHGFDSADASGHLNDLWTYNPSTLEWTWVAGSNLRDASASYGVLGTPAATNVPGARDSCASWLDSSGRLWLFGGFGFDSANSTGHLNDLWMFDPISVEWTWVSGGETKNQTGTYGTKGATDPDNVPGARYRSLSWQDSEGKFWLFGGSGLDSVGAVGYLNDLWRFDPVTREWTWVSGSEYSDQTGVYGTKGTAAPGNFPGSRDASVLWIDSNSHVWIFGGDGWDGAGHQGYLNDLWMYDPSTLQWTWISGDLTADQPGVYGTLGTSSISNFPGGNRGANSWIDSNGIFWLFGGMGYDSAGNLGLLNALWKFDPLSKEWTWVSGQKTFNQPGEYATKGKRYLTNTPGGRNHAVSWTSPAGDLWLFGGEGYDSDGISNYINDIWKYKR